MPAKYDNNYRFPKLMNQTQAKHYLFGKMEYYDFLALVYARDKNGHKIFPLKKIPRIDPGKTGYYYSKTDLDETERLLREKPDIIKQIDYEHLLKEIGK